MFLTWRYIFDTKGIIFHIHYNFFLLFGCNNFLFIHNLHGKLKSIFVVFKPLHVFCNLLIYFNLNGISFPKEFQWFAFYPSLMESFSFTLIVKINLPMPFNYFLCDFNHLFLLHLVYWDFLDEANHFFFCFHIHYLHSLNI
jgi:hypothetical protein